MATLTGVGFLLFALIDNTVKIFTVIEKKTKPELSKKAGMITFPFETVEESDSSIRAAIQRLIDEEIDYPGTFINICEVFPEPLYGLIPNIPEIPIYCSYGIYCGDHRRPFNPQDDDIEFAGWKTAEQLFNENFKRVEVAPMLLYFMQSIHYEKLLIQLKGISAQ